MGERAQHLNINYYSEQSHIRPTFCIHPSIWYLTVSRGNIEESPLGRRSLWSIAKCFPHDIAGWSVCPPSTCCQWEKNYHDLLQDQDHAENLLTPAKEECAQNTAAFLSNPGRNASALLHFCISIMITWLWAGMEVKEQCWTAASLISSICHLASDMGLLRTFSNMQVVESGTRMCCSPSQGRLKFSLHKE